MSHLLRHCVARVQADSNRPVSSEDRTRSQLRPSEICGGGDGPAAGFLLQVFPFFTVRIIPKVFHTHLHLHVALTRRTKARSSEPSKMHCVFGNRVTLNTKFFTSSCVPEQSSYHEIFPQMQVLYAVKLMWSATPWTCILQNVERLNLRWLQSANGAAFTYKFLFLETFFIKAVIGNKLLWQFFA